ncbi:MAG TPA: helix-turn-helix domain-containing protein [Caulobacterales bacterium]|nr:helix-turn-helix domain-containing protein [Caulobacterales bacterium]
MVIPQDNDAPLSVGYHRQMQTKRRRIYLREWREFRGKTQAQVAEALGVTKTHVSNIENGKRQYTQALLEAAAEYLQCEPSHILNVDPAKPDGIWSIWELAQQLPEDRRDDARRVMKALAEKAPEKFEAEPAKPKPKRAKR